MKTIAVKPRWIYNKNNNNGNSSARSLPDFIEFDIELESGKITLNLEQSTESIKPPMIITESEGQSSIWKQPKDEVSNSVDLKFEFRLDLRNVCSKLENSVKDPNFVERN